MAEPEADARAALLALFAASKPRTPQGTSIEAVDSESATQRAGVALRQLFKGEFQRALNPPAAVGRLKEIEGHVAKLLEQVQPGAKFKPPPRARPSSRSKTGVDVEVQTLALHAVPSVKLAEPSMPQPVPDPDEGKPRPRCCVIQDNSESGESMRKRCLEAQRRLYTLDAEVTSLSSGLKRLRIAHWEKQRYKCAKEKEIEAFFAAHADEFRSNGVALPDQEEIAKKQAELCSMKQHAKQWSKQARRLDAELQQQFRGGGDVQRILLRHPAGEVFLPPMGPMDSDDGSEDEYYRGSSPKGADVHLASSDEDSDEYTGGGGRPLAGGEHKPPPPPSQQWRSMINPDEDNASEGTSGTSPSAESGGVRSPLGGESPSRNRLGAGPSVQRPRSDTESSSDEDDKGASYKPSRTSPTRTSPKGEKNSKLPVPPLPGLSGLGNGNGNGSPTAAKPKAAVANDEVAEVSSEDIWSQDGDNESSRSV